MIDRLVIFTAQQQIWEAEYFIGKELNVDYWRGRKDSAMHILDICRAVGISVEEVVSQMVNHYTK